MQRGTCGPGCQFWQPTGVSRCEGICDIHGGLTLDGQDCEVDLDILSHGNGDSDTCGPPEHRDQQREDHE